MLQHGADPNPADNDGVTPCMWAAIHGHEDCLRALAEGGPGGTLTDDDHINAVATGVWWTGKTALDLAVARHNNDIAEFLRGLGAVRGAEL